MRIETSHSCCGHRAISGLEGINLKTGKLTIQTREWPYSDLNIALRTAIKAEYWQGKPCQAFSWIANERQAAFSAKLKSEFEKLKFKVQTVRLNVNPKSGNKMHMRIAVRT